MFLPRRMLPLLAALVASATAQNSTTVKLEGWYKCSEVTFESELPEDATASMLTGAECATFKAPLCHDGVCDDASNTQIDIFVKRISGTFAANRPNIFFMQGGPGAASPAMEDAMTSIYSILDGDVNVYTMDHRGTGRSTKLDCVAAQAQMTGGVAGSSVDATEVAACADELHAKYGSDLSSFSVTSAASDLKYFITNFLEGQTTFVYGVSYGSSLVERLIHLNTDGIAGYILDGISTTSGSDKKNFEYFSTWDVDYDEVGDYFLSKCAKNQAECGKYFPDASVAQTLRTLMSKLNSKEAKCTAPLDAILSNMYKYVPGTEGAPTPDVLLRSLFGSLLASSRSRKYIPVLTYRMNRCNDDDVKVINHFMNMYFGGASEFSEEDAFSSDLVYKLIVYSEFWETPTPSYETMLARFMNTTISSGSYSEVENYCVFTKEDSKACADYADAQKYDAKPIVYKKDKYWNVAAKPPKDVSVLLMSSKMDPQTPHKYAEFLYKALDTENKQLITFDQATHATLWTTPMSESSSAPTCGMQIVSSYIQEGGDLKKMDTSCVALMPSVSFTLSDSSIALLLNTTSPYDGVFTGTDVVPKAYTEPAKSNGSPSSSTNNSSGSDSSGKSYLGVFIAFAVAFAIAAIAAAVFVVKWRRAKKEGLQNANVYEASTV